jgi:hypothetical protein
MEEKTNAAGTGRVQASEKKAITRKDAETLLLQWGESLEVDVESDGFQKVIKQLAMAVMKERLSFDEMKRVFTYQLISPIEKKDGSGSIEILTIKELSMQETKVVQRFKESESIQQSEALIAESCGLELGFAGRLLQRDVGNINGVIVGFFVKG